MNGKWQQKIISRYKSDAERLENASRKLIGVTRNGPHNDIPKSSDRSQDRAWALREICTFYHIPTPDFRPDRLENEAYVERLLRKNGIMSRGCILRDGWEKDAFGPYLCQLKSGVTAALLPGNYGRYACTDRSTGEKMVINGKNCGQVEEEAVFYYRAVPQKKMSFGDLLRFMISCVTGGELFLILLSALAVTLLSIFYPIASKWMMTLVIPSGNSELVTSLLAAYTEESGLTGEPESTGGGTYAKVLKQGVAFGAGFPDDEDLAHQANEFVDLNKMILSAKIYANALLRLCAE